MEQHYDRYTLEDQNVWQTLYEQQIGQIMESASEAYLKGLLVCNFNKSIPKITELNEILLSVTGWKIEIVPGLIDNQSFFQLLSEKKFPASTWLRQMKSLDYLEEPDMFHDIFGHAPLLTNKDFCEFLVALANTALKFIDHENSIELISRIYWYSVEFGLILEKQQLKIFGAGILSSRSESRYALYADEPFRLDFNIGKIMITPYIKDKFQEKYFVIDSYTDLFKSIENLEFLLSTLQSKFSVN